MPKMFVCYFCINQKCTKLNETIDYITAVAHKRNCLACGCKLEECFVNAEQKELLIED